MALHTALTIDAYALLVLADQRRIRDYGQLPQLAKDEIGRVRGETLKDREDHEIVNARIAATRVNAPGSASTLTSKIARTTGCGETIDLTSPG